MKKILLSITALFLTLSLCACYKIDTANTDDYTAFYNKCTDIQVIEDMFTNPEIIESFDEVVIYYSDYDLIDSFHTIYLNYNLNSENYNQEKQRIIDFGKTSDITIFNSEEFSYNSVYLDQVIHTLRNEEAVAVNVSYVLFDDANNKIISVDIFDDSLDLKNDKRFTAISDEYLPKELVELKNQ